MPNANTKKLPLYIQIGDLLHREIAAGHWQAGERLPIEAELAKDLKVAVGTLRKALTKLEQDGLLERRQGSGTYVKKAPSGQAIYQFFHLELHAGGGAPSADTLSIDQVKNPTIASHLALNSSQAKLWRIRRVRFLNNVTVAAEEIWLAAKHDPKLDQRVLNESLYMHYREHFDFWISKVEDRLDCAPAPHWTEKILNLDQQKTLCRVERKSWSNENQVQEYSMSWFNPDKCRYVARWA